MCADDNLHALHSRFSRELDHINKWIEANKVKLNVSKTHVLNA